MHIEWISKEDSDFQKFISSDGYLSHKLINSHELNGHTVLTLLIEKNLFTHSLIKKIDELVDVFPSISIKLGLISNDEKYENFNFEFSDSGITYIVGSQDLFESFHEVYQHQSDCKNTVHISKKADTDKKTIGYQRHFSFAPHLPSVSLGELKENFDLTDSLIRNAKNIFFNLSALRQQDCQHSASAVSGLNIYQASKLIRSAGLSNKQSVLFFNTELKTLNHASESASTILFWYYLEGLKHRLTSEKMIGEHLIYLVENPFYEMPIKFIKETKTNSWWFFDPENDNKTACSQMDYKNFSNGQVPEIFLSLSH